MSEDALKLPLDATPASYHISDAGTFSFVVGFFFTLEENRNSTKRKRKKKEPHHIVCSYLEALVQNNLLSSWGWATEEGVERGWRIRSLTANLREPKSLYRSPPGGTAGLRTGGRWAARFNQPAMRLASNPDLQICKHRCHTSPFPQSSVEFFFFFLFVFTLPSLLPPGSLGRT